jgi:hypothetical protein
MDISLEKSHTLLASERPDDHNGEKGREVTESPQPPPAREEAGHDEIKKGSEQISVPEEDEKQFPRGVALALIMFSIWLALFLVALVSHSPRPSPESNSLLTNIRIEPS